MPMQKMLSKRQRCVSHRHIYHMFTSRVGDDGAINGLAIEHDALDTLLRTIRMDGNLVLSLAELTVHRVVGSRLGQTRIDADAIVVGLDTEDELRYRIPHPGSRTREPRVLTLTWLEGVLTCYHLAVDVRLHLVQRLVFLFHV